MNFIKKISLFTSTMLITNSISLGGSLIVHADIKVSMPTFNALKPDSFITKSGDKLMDDDKELRFVSLNYPGGASDDAFAQEDAVKSIMAMGGKVTRSYVISVKRYDGSNASTAMVTAPNTFNEEAFKKLDNLLALCDKYGVRVIVPLVDQWSWVGGIESYAKFEGLNITGDATVSSDAWKFYTDAKIIADFKQTISYVLNRTNTVTGRQYKDEPSVLAWETGNELGGYNQDKFPQAWTTDIAAYIQGLDSNHLVMDGRYKVNVDSVNDPNVDIISNHYYQGNYVENMKADRAITKGKKPLILGEFGALTTVTKIDALFDEVVSDGTSGAMIWSLRPHNSLGGFNWHVEDPGNWAAYHWPGFASGDSYDETNIIKSVYKHAHTIDGEVAPTAIPAPDPLDKPSLFPITSVDDFRWTGVVGASSYEISRSNDGTTGWTVVGEGSDCGTSGVRFFQDTSAIDGHTYFYKIRGKNESGYSGYSNVVKVDSAKHTMIDRMYDLTNIYSSTSNVKVSTYLEGPQAESVVDSVGTTNSTPGFIVYAAPTQITAINVNATGTSTNLNATFSVSNNNGVYTSVKVTKTTVSGKVTYSVATSDIPSGTKYVRIDLPSSSVKVSRVEINYTNTTGEALGGTQTVSTNGVVFDNDISSYYSKTANVVEATASTTASVEGLKAFGNNNGNKGSIVYRTPGDMTSFRVATYFDPSKTATDFVMSTSPDGNTYKTLTPTITSKAHSSSVWDKKYYTSFTLPAGTRYLKIDYPTAVASACVISRVELSYGNKLIELAESSPNSVLEDGEYYYGSNSILNNAYAAAGGDIPTLTLDTVNKNNGNGALAYNYKPSANWWGGVKKSLNNADFSASNSVQLWIKPDGSKNKLIFRFTDTSGIAYHYDYQLTSGDTSGRVIIVPFSQFTQETWSVTGSGAKALDLKHMDFFYIGFSASENEKGPIYFDDIKVLDPNIVDNYDGYGGYDILPQTKYVRNTGGGSVALSLDTTNKYDGNYGLKVKYDTGSNGYCGVTLTPDKLNLTGSDGLQLWIKPDGSRNKLAIQYTTADGSFWETNYVMQGTDARMVYIPFSSFKYPSWYSSDTTKAPDSTKDITSFSMYMGDNGATTINKSGTIYIDAVKGYKNSDLTSGSVSITSVLSSEVTSMPCTITGTATNAKYVNLLVGKQVLSAPVKTDGTWTYDIKYLQNGSNTIKASVQSSDGVDLVTPASITVNINVADNTYKDGDPVDALPVEVIPDTTPPDTAINYVVNPGFEVGSTGSDLWTIPNWDKSDWMVKAQASGARTGKYDMVAYNGDAYKVNATQTVTNLPEGIYELTAWTKSTGGQNSASMMAIGDAAAILRADIPTGTDSYTQIKISNIRITKGSCTIKFDTDAKGGNWFAVDDVKLTKVSDINYISNPSFEDNTDGTTANYFDISGWTKSGPDAGDGKIENAKNHTGKYQLAAWDNKAYQLSIYQNIVALTPGIYELRAWTRSTGGQNSCDLYAEGYGGDKLTADIDAGDTYTQLVIPNIKVTNGQCIVGIETSGNANNWFTADDVELVKTGELAISAVDKAALTTAIDNATALLESKTIGSAVGNVSLLAKTIFQSAITAANVVKTDVAATQTAVDGQVLALATATNNFNDAVINVDPTVTVATTLVVKAEASKLQSDKEIALASVNALPVSAEKTALLARVNAIVIVIKTVLTTAINEATTLIESKTVGTAKGNVPKTAKLEFQSAIATATAVKTDVAATQAAVDAQVLALATATNNFNNAVIKVDPAVTAGTTLVVLDTGNVTGCVNYIKNATSASKIVVNITEKHIAKAIFDAFKGTDKTITFKEEGIEWVFYGKDITNETKALDLTIDVAKLTETTSANKAALIEKFKNADVSIISFADNGLLPGRATVKVKLSSDWLVGKDKNNIHIYYYNKTTKLAELVAKGIKVDVEGYVQFSITHNSDYVVSDKDLVQAGILPKTGSGIDMVVLLGIGVLILLFGVVTLGFRKKQS
ncbi:MAG: CIA30 family protein [Clostridiaceae bacterium]|nr:CIA30 family protein [Clostridiaceae bacterium]